MKKTLSMLMASLLMIALLPGLGAGTARAGDTIYWGEAQSAVYDQIHPYTLNWSGDVLDRGGLNLTSMTYESKSANADIVINQYGDIGALSIRKLSGEGLSDPTPGATSGFSSSLKMEQGAVYLVALHDASYAKIRIDQIFPDNGFSITKVKFSYVFEERLPASGNGSGSSSGSSSGEPGIGSPAVDLLNPAESYVFEGEGAITIPWTPSPGEYGWDIYRSDNGAPYAKVTDFVITETEYVDHYVFVGRTYLYKLVSYDRNGKLLAISEPIKVTLVPLGRGGSAGNGPSSGYPAPSAPASKRIVLQLGNTTAYVNDKAHKLEVAPFNYNGRTVLPLRFVGEALGLDVKWNGQARSITLKSDKDTIVLVLDDSQATVNGKRVMMDVPAFIHGKVTMVPIRFVSEQLKQKITFDNATKKITIESQTASGNGTGGNPQPAPGSSGSGAQQPAPGTSGGGAKTPASDASYFIGSWSMWVPAGKDGADGGTLTIHADGTFSYRWNGVKSGTWSYDSDTGRLLLSGYKSGWDWTVTKTDTGITVSSYSVYEKGVRLP